jgi:hypothetical protein
LWVLVKSAFAVFDFCEKFSLAEIFYSRRAAKKEEGKNKKMNIYAFRLS